MKLAVVGSRTFDDYKKLERHLDGLDGPITLIVSGGARGADSLAERYANEHAITTKIFYPDWNQFGKSAGYRRNKDIVDFSDALIAFRVNRSKGTTHSINLALEKGIPVYIIDMGDFR